MIIGEVYSSIFASLSRKDLDTLLVTNRQLGRLSQWASKGRKPRRLSLNHFHDRRFNVEFECVRRILAFDDLPRYLKDSHLIDVDLDATRLDADTLRGM